MISKENAEHYVWSGVCDGWDLLKTADLSVIQERVPPGSSEVEHYHEKAHQFFFVLNGQMTMKTDEGKVILKAGHGISIPPGMRHKVSNEGKRDVEFLVISSPKSHGDRILV